MVDTSSSSGLGGHTAVDKERLKLAFEDWYKRLWVERSLVDVLSMRIDMLLYECHKAAYIRGHSDGYIQGKEEQREEYRQSLADDRRVSVSRRPTAPQTLTVAEAMALNPDQE